MKKDQLIVLSLIILSFLFQYLACGKNMNNSDYLSIKTQTMQLVKYDIEIYKNDLVKEMQGINNRNDYSKLLSMEHTAEGMDKEFQRSCRKHLTEVCNKYGYTPKDFFLKAKNSGEKQITPKKYGFPELE